MSHTLTNHRSSHNITINLNIPTSALTNQTTCLITLLDTKQPFNMNSGIRSSVHHRPFLYFATSSWVTIKDDPRIGVSDLHSSSSFKLYVGISDIHLQYFYENIAVYLFTKYNLLELRPSNHTFIKVFYKQFLNIHKFYIFHFYKFYNIEILYLFS